MNTKTSRRTVLNATAAGLAAGAIAAPPMAAEAGEHPDAELLRLGNLFEAHRRQSEIYKSALKAVEPKWERELARRGIDFVYEREKAREVALETGYEQAMDTYCDELDKLGPIGERIMAIPPRTLDGLRVYAVLARSEAISGENKARSFRDMDWDAACIFRLCEAVDAIAAQA